MSFIASIMLKRVDSIKVDGIRPIEAETTQT